MQFTIDSAQRSYLLRTNLINKQKESADASQPVPDRSITLMDKGTALFAGASIAEIVRNLKQTNSKFFLTRFERIKALPTYEESQKVADSMIKNEKLKDKGVKVLFVENNDEGQKQVSDLIYNNTLANFRKKFNIGEKNIISKGIRKYADLNAPLITKGKKTSYLVNQKVAIASKATHQQIFHELGHAKVAENKTLRPILTLGKKMPVLAVISGFCALQYTPKPKNEANKRTSWDKTQDFLDENSGRIVFATYMPLLAEKYMASRYGLKHLEKSVDKQKVASVKKLYRVGLVTYLATAFAAAVGIGLGNKVQNNIIKQKQTPHDVYNLLI